MTDQAKNAAHFIRQKAGYDHCRLAILLGSGAGDVAQQLTDSVSLAYHEIPGFVSCSVSGHAGMAHIGHLAGVPTIALQGRWHYYEGMTGQAIITMIHCLKWLGVETLIITNAAGSLDSAMMPGELALITDHINLQFNNPLVGLTDESFGSRFVNMAQAYDPDLRQHMKHIAQSHHITLHEGVYIGVLGPSFETPAEIEAFRRLGAQLVGMSTVPEVIVARHAELNVVALSVITNYAAGLSKTTLSHAETLRGAKLAQHDLIALLMGFVQSYRI